MQMLASAVVLALALQTSVSGAQPPSSTIAPAARVVTPARPAKLKLIRQFLRAIGLQQKLDTGSFLEHYAVPGGPMWPAAPNTPLIENLSDGFKLRFDALKKAYEARRITYQKAYEDHLNWEFSEAELKEIVAFLSKPVGQHYLDGRWRMEAYTSTNTEDLEEAIVQEAIASLKK